MDGNVATMKSEIPERRKHYVSERVDSILLKSLPPINYDAADLHNNHIAFPSSTLYLAAWIALFAYLFIAGVETATGSQFLSIDGTSDSQVCEDVPQPLTGTFTVDKYGIWNVESGYQLNSSFLEFEFSGTEVTLQDYTAVIEKFRQKIITYDDKMKMRDLSYNLLTWVNIEEYDANSKITMRSTADYKKIFSDFGLYSGEYIGFQIPDEVSGGTPGDDYCYTRDPTVSPKFDPGLRTNRLNPPFISLSDDGEFIKYSWNLDDMRLNRSMDIEDYNSFDKNVLQPCGNIFRLANGDLSGYNNIMVDHISDTRGAKMGDFTRDFDIRSIIVACALNKGILSTNVLVASDYQPIGYSQYNLKLYTHPKFPGMREIMCSFGNTSSVCFLYTRAYANTRLAYPEMTQRARTYDTDQEIYCKCSANQDDHWNCQKFSFEIGIIEFAERQAAQFVSLYCTT